MGDGSAKFVHPTHKIYHVLGLGQWSPLDNLVSPASRESEGGDEIDNSIRGGHFVEKFADGG